MQETRGGLDYSFGTGVRCLTNYLSIGKSSRLQTKQAGYLLCVSTHLILSACWEEKFCVFWAPGAAQVQRLSRWKRERGRICKGGKLGCICYLILRKSVTTLWLLCLIEKCSIMRRESLISPRSLMEASEFKSARAPAWRVWRKVRPFFDGNRSGCRRICKSGR